MSQCLFLIFTGDSCLDWDEESYADMMTVTNTEHDKDTHPDMFYLDSDKLEWNPETLTALLPIVFNSIVRNAMLGNTELLDDDSALTFESVTKVFQEDYKLELPTEITELLSYSAIFDNSKQIVKEFLKKGYQDQIQGYYEKVVIAENLKVTTLKDKTTKEQLMTLTSAEIIALMTAIGDALTYRNESYTCSPTVVHVVRIIQAQAQAQAGTKFDTSVPKEVCTRTSSDLIKPQCKVGRTGFILSALEQLGYMYRFYKTYCIETDSHYDKEKCSKKMAKYDSRYKNAIENLKTLQEAEVAEAVVGGKRLKQYTPTKNTYSKHYHHKCNYKNKTKRLLFKSLKGFKKYYKKHSKNKRRFAKGRQITQGKLRKNI